MPRSRKPTPEHVKTVCSLCGLDWDKHPDEPTVYDCIELLKVAANKPPRVEYVPYYPYWWTKPEAPLREASWEPPPKWTQPTITCSSPLGLEGKL